jgi:hypothetical protein
MRNQISAVLAAVLITTTMIPTQSFATIALPLLPVLPPSAPAPVAHGSGGGGAGAGAAAGIIGVAAFLVSYDLIRRTTCSGDFLQLGGPGFTEPMVVGNVMIPQCPVALHNGKRHKH